MFSATGPIISLTNSLHSNELVCYALDNVWICRSSTYRYILQIQLIIFLTSCAEATENIFNFYTLELTPEKGLNVSLLPFTVISLPLMWRLNFIFWQFPQPQNSIKISSTSSPDGPSHITENHHGSPRNGRSRSYLGFVYSRRRRWRSTRQCGGCQVVP